MSIVSESKLIWETENLSHYREKRRGRKFRRDVVRHCRGEGSPQKGSPEPPSRWVPFPVYPGNGGAR